MVLNKSLITIPLLAGLNTKSDPFQVPMDGLLDLQNATFSNPGKISKRNGFAAMTNQVLNNNNINSGFALASYGDELLCFSGTTINSFAPAMDKWINKGNCVSVIAELNSLVKNSYEQYNATCAYAEGFECYAWEDSRGGIYCSLIDSESKATILQEQFIDITGQNPQVVFLEGKFIILYTSAANIYYFAVDPLTPVINFPVLLTNQLNEDRPNYDTVVYGDKLIITFYNLNSEVWWYRYTSLASPPEQAQVLTSGRGEFAVGLTHSLDGYAWVFGSSGGDVTCGAVSPTGSVTFTMQTVEIVLDVVRICAYGKADNSVQVFYDINDSENHRIRQCNVYRFGSTFQQGHPSDFNRACAIYSKPYAFRDGYYLTTSYQSYYQSSYFTFDMQGNVIARNAYTTGGGNRTGSTCSQPAEIPSNSSGIVLLAVGEKGELESEGGFDLFTPVGLSSLRLDFLNPNQFLNTTYANVMHVVGGVIQDYDTSTLTENNFLLYPEGVEASESGAIGGLSEGSYLYVATYEWTDALGQVQRSTTSLPAQVTTTHGNAAVTIEVPTLRVTQKTGARGNVRITIYRTEVGQSLIYYRVTSLMDPVINDMQFNTITYTDTMSDAALISSELLYTTGGVLDNTAPPACSLVCNYGTRVFIAGLENKNTLMYSKNYEPGSPLNFAFEFTLQCNEVGGDISALAEMDNKLIVFKESAIFKVTGDGPNNLGQENEYALPSLITSDVGCVEPNSIARTDDGIFFKSRKGIFFLDRSEKVTYLGDDVAGFNDLAITSARLMPNTTEVRFTTDGGIILVYDYYVQKWSYWTNLSAVDSEIWNGVYVILGNNGIVKNEQAGVFNDDGEYISLKATTSWIKMGALEGYGRCWCMWWLGTYYSAHDIIVRVAYDFQPFDTQFLGPIDAKSIVFGGSAYGQGEYGDGVYGGAYYGYQARLKLNKTKCTSIKITFEDVQQAGGVAGKGFDLSSLTFEVGIKQGGNKLRPGATLNINR